MHFRGKEIDERTYDLYWISDDRWHKKMKKLQEIER